MSRPVEDQRRSKVIGCDVASSVSKVRTRALRSALPVTLDLRSVQAVSVTSWASPTAYPNRLMIRLADAALGREGRMVRAVEAMGRGVPAGEAEPFSIAADHSS